MNIEIRQKDDSISWEELTNLFHESFQERLDQGLHFICSDFTPEYLERNSVNNVVLIAVDKENDVLAGAAFVEIKQKGHETWGYLSNMAIKPDYKRCGIGSKLEKQRIEIANAHGCDYVLSDTAAGADSSINWHLKNGFKFYELISWPNTNYYSYNFRKQLKHHPLWSNDLFCKLHFWYSSIICRLKYQANGEHTPFMKWYIKLRNLI